MRALLTALVVLAAWPAGAAAQITVYPQDISVTGQVIASPSAAERIVRFTVTNHGPGSFAGTARLSLQVDPTVAYLRLTGPCTMTPPATWAAGCLAFPAGEGAAQSFDVIAGFHGTRNYDRDQVTGSLSLTDPAGQPAVDANPANQQVRVDMGITAPGPALILSAVIPGILTHGKPATFMYAVANTGGQDLLDIRMGDDRCPNPTLRNTAVLPAGYSPPTSAGGTCAYTPPAHVKGEPATLTTTVTATARTAVGELLTATRTFSSRIAEPTRPCGTLRARQRGRRERTWFRAESTVADRPCKTVRRQLVRCIQRRKAPVGFRCQTVPGFGRLFKPGAAVQTHMVARKA